jgi:hypothetical protein
LPTTRKIHSNWKHGRSNIDEFADFIHEYWHVSDRKKISLETQFEGDLGLTGDDENDLLEATEKRFGVTLQNPPGPGGRFSDSLCGGT